MPALDLSLQQMPYEYENPTNAFWQEEDILVQKNRELLIASLEYKKVLTITVELTPMEKPILDPILTAAPQSHQVRFHFDGPINPPMQENPYSDPAFLANLNEQAKTMTDHGWKFNAEKLSLPVPRLHSSPELEINTIEADWLKHFKLSQVIKERRARQAAMEKAKQSIPWEPNDVNVDDYELFNNASLDKELNAFFGPIKTDVPTNNDGDADDNAATTTTWVPIPETYPSQTEYSTDFDMDLHGPFVDSAISIADQFPAEFGNMSTTGTATGDFFSNELDKFSQPNLTMEDFYTTDFDNVPLASPTFPIQETGEEDRNYFRSLYCNTNGVENKFPDAPHDIDGFATNGVGNQSPNTPHDLDGFTIDGINHSSKNQSVSSLYDPKSLSVHDANESYNEKMRYTFAFPDDFLHYNIPPAFKTVVKPGQVNNNPAENTTPDASVQVNAPDVSQQCLATSIENTTRSPDRSAAVGNQLITDLQADANSTLGNFSAPSIRAESESSPDIILSPPVRRRRQTNLLPEYDSDSDDTDSDDSVDVLPLSSPVHFRGTSTANRLAHNKYPCPRVVPSTPRKRSHSEMQTASPEDSFFNNPVTGTRVNVASHYGSYQTLTAPTPISAGPSTPTTPRTPGYSSLPPYQSSYSYATSPTPNGPRITTVLHGQVLNTPPKTRTPEIEPKLKAKRLARAYAATKAATAAKEAADKEAAAKEAAAQVANHSSGPSEQPIKKRVRRSKLKNAESADEL